MNMNVLFIMTDALRPSHLGCYGYSKNTSPNIDRLAKNGVMFKNFIATASHTLPPVISYLTGQDTVTHKVVNQETFMAWKEGAWKGRETPLTVMRENGILVDGELVMRWAPAGFDKDTPSNEIEEYFSKNRNRQWFFFAEPYNTHLPYNPGAKYFEMFLDKDYEMSEGTRKRMEVVKNCLIVHPSDVISRLEAGEKEALPDDDSDESHKRTAGTADLQEEDKAAIHALYDGEVKVFDELVGRYIAKLEKLGLLENTLIIICSDHGEELMERGHVGHCSCNLKGTLYDESIKIPMIMYCPALLPKGKVIGEQASEIDVMPTIFELLGLEMPSPCDGASLLPLIHGKASSFREEAYCETPPAGWQALSNDRRNMWSVRTNEWKLIMNTDFDLSFKDFELYDLKGDPGEKINLYGQGLSIEAVLKEKLERHISKEK